jgi:membrane protease YdiL (CAAX protease family)
MTLVVVAVGALAQLIAWWFVAARGSSVWMTTAPVLAIAGAVAIAVDPPLSGLEPVALAAIAGVAAGVALYVGTRAFVAIVVGRWTAFARHAAAIYRGGDQYAPATVFAAAAIAAAGEEVFWRGLAQGELGSRLGAAAAGAVAAWIAYVVANAPSRNLAILAGAVVGGAAWGALAWWSGGVIASVASHTVWTTLMIAFPVVDRERA